jgi:hypothetical protein
VSTYSPIVWALKHAPHLRNGKGGLDAYAQLTLAHLALYADTDGRNAYPAIGTIAERSGLSDQVVGKALQRLADAGLIAKEGVHESGTTIWRLLLNVVRPVDAMSPVELARKRRQEKTAARVAAFRRRQREGTTPSDSVTTDGKSAQPDTSNALGDGYVTPSESVSNAVGERHVTPSQRENLPLDLPSTFQKDLPEKTCSPGGERASESESDEVGTTDGITSRSQEATAPVVAESKEGKDGDESGTASSSLPSFDEHWLTQGKEGLGMLQARKSDIYGTWRADDVAARLRRAFEGSTRDHQWVNGAGLADLVQAPQLTLVEAS